MPPRKKENEDPRGISNPRRTHTAGGGIQCKVREAYLRPPRREYRSIAPARLVTKCKANIYYLAPGLVDEGGDVEAHEVDEGHLFR